MWPERPDNTAGQADACRRMMEALTFYYPDNIDLLERAGVNIKAF